MANSYLTPETRFWLKVNKRGAYFSVLGRCWIWTGRKSSGMQYGLMVINGRGIYVHRYSWELHNELIPKGLCVLHKCDNPVCVNPNHLFLGTRTDNSIDRDSKERQARGIGHPNSKLTDKQVKDIRSNYKRGSYGRSNRNQLAEEFGVSISTIKRVINRTSWRHLK